MHRQLDTRTVAVLKCRRTSPSMLSYLSKALAHLKADNYAHMRHVRIKLRAAGRAKAKEAAEQQADPGIIAALMLHELNTVERAA